nr:hypothetical protein [Crateriforma conspicua]
MNVNYASVRVHLRDPRSGKVAVHDSQDAVRYREHSVAGLPVQCPCSQLGGQV